MKNLSLFTALDTAELTNTTGGQIVQNLEDSNTLPIIGYGDPREWDIYFPINGNSGS